MNYELLKAQLTQAEEFNNAGKYEEAEKLANKVLAEMNIPSSPSLLRERLCETEEELHCSALITLSTSKMLCGDFHTALSLAHASIDIAEEINIPVLKARGLGNCGSVYKDLSDYTNALMYLEKALAIFKEIGSKKGIAAGLNTIGSVYMDLADYTNALTYFQKALATSEEIDSKVGIANSLGNIGIVCFNLSDYANALMYFQKALAIFEEIDSKNGIANNLRNIGNAYSQLSDYANALKYYQKALAINEEIGSKIGNARNLDVIGSVYAHLSDYANALTYYQKALAINEEIGSKIDIAINLGNIGLIYANISDNTKALTYFHKSLAIYEEHGNKEGIVRILGNIGQAYQNLSDYANALEYSWKALAINEETGRKYPIAANLDTIGSTYAKPDFDGFDAAKAEEFLLKAIEIGEEIGSKELLYQIHNNLADLYKNEERWKDFAIHFEKYYNIKEEVHSEEAKKQAVLMEQQKQAAEREKALTIEREISKATTSILHKVLPPSIADRLIKGEKIADYFTSVSILFADIVGFTPIASKMPARKVLAFLNYVFGEFDRICESHGCEKIKTIGDGYMAVAGAPIECPDHAERIARAAMEMMGDIQLPEDIRSALPKGAIFNIRIGINIGPAFGGIVGENRFVYDIYSDAVNTAARMESHGEPGKIHVSEEFAFHLQNRMDMVGDDLGGIVFVEREEIEIKGKGMMKTYFMEAKP